MKHLLSVLMAISVILVAGCGTPPVKVGDRAPDFTLPGIDGKDISLGSYTGKPVIINTWNVNCIECKKEMPFFQEIGKQYADKGLIIISVNTLDSLSTTREFLSKNGYSFVTVLDIKQDIYKKYGCPKAADPYTFFIGTDGVVKSVKVGGFTSQKELENEVEKIVKQ